MEIHQLTTKRGFVEITVTIADARWSTSEDDEQKELPKAKLQLPKITVKWSVKPHTPSLTPTPHSSPPAKKPHSKQVYKVSPKHKIYTYLAPTVQNVPTIPQFFLSDYRGGGEGNYASASLTVRPHTAPKSHTV